MKQAKSYCITKQQVWEAYKKVKANKGAAGVDGQTIEKFEEDMKDNLYKLWNRLASGSYFPPPVLRVEIPKSDGGIRPLGIPTIADRIAQMVVKKPIGTGTGETISYRLLWLPTRQIGIGCGRSSAKTLLEV